MHHRADCQVTLDGPTELPSPHRAALNHGPDTVRRIMDSDAVAHVLRFSFFAPGERMYPEPSVFVYIVCVGSTAASIRRRESALLDKQLPDGIQDKKSGLLQSVDSLQGNIHRDILAVSSVKVAVSGSYRP